MVRSSYPRIEVSLQLRCFLVFHCEILCIMWQLHFARFLKHVFLITLGIRRLLICTTYRNTMQLLCIFGRYFCSTFLWYVCTTYWNNATATFRFHFLLRLNFFTSQLRYLFVQMVSFFDNVRITLNYGNCWNVWIVSESYVI